jgi:predicted SAM-dependent methyltransferase
MRDIPSLELFPHGKQRVEEARGVKRVLLRILPHHALSLLKHELHMTRVRLGARGAARAQAGGTDLLVNIGAGGDGREGWVNMDAFESRNVNCVYDVRKQLPFADGVVRGIFCEHFFEHLDYVEEVPYFLSECLRVMKPGGVLRIVVPDAERYIMAYAKGGWGELSSIRSLTEGRKDPWLHGTEYNTRMELINLVFRQGNEHKFAYDYETLAFVLERYGCVQVARRGFGESRLPEICIDKKERAPESLYVEGVKPSVVNRATGLEARAT